jgi:hypothetical protein
MRRCAVVVVLGLGCGRLGFGTHADATGGPGDSTRDSVDPATDGSAASSLVAWWPMTTDPSSGVIDATGHGHDGTCAGPCPSQITGVTGNAYSFDGTQIIDVADAADLHTPDAFTVAAWLDLDTEPAGAVCATTKLLGSGFLNSWALCVETSFEVFFYTSQLATGGQDMTTMAGSFAPNTWTHVAVRWDGSDKAIYVNGSNAGTMASPGIDFDTGGVVLGADRDSGSAVSFWTGGLADVRVYSAALSDAEIAALATP